jgi:cytochrome c oxidase subunit 2
MNKQLGNKQGGRTKKKEQKRIGKSKKTKKQEKMEKEDSQQKNEKAKAEKEAETAKVWTLTESMARGETVYNQNCAVCHKVDGTGQPPVFPALKASSVAVGQPISRHIDIVLHGVPGTAMQPFANQFNDTDIAALVTYERNAWGNNTGNVIQPADVKARRKTEKSS